MLLDEKTKSLISVGASITANCQPCLQLHIGKAIEHGANEQEVREAIAVARAVRKGATAKMDEFVSSQIKDTETA